MNEIPMSQIHVRLGLDETLLWQGRPHPDPGYLIGHFLIVVCVLGITLLGATTGAWLTAAGFGFAACCGLKEIVVSERDRRRTQYGLSNQRAWIVNFGMVRSFPLDSLDNVRVGYELAGRGKVYAQSTCGDWPHRNEAGASVNGPLFSVIKDPNFVQSLIIECSHGQGQSAACKTRTCDDYRIRDWLLRDEMLLWTGRSSPRMELTRRDLLLILLVPLSGFIAWNVVDEAIDSRSVRREGIGAVSDVTLWLLVAGCALFISIIVYGAIIRHIIEIWRRKTTVYGLTTERGIVLRPGSLTVFPLHAMHDIRVDTNTSQRGSLRCTCDMIEWLSFQPSVRFHRDRGFDGRVFTDIPDPFHVLQLALVAQCPLEPDDG